MPPEDNTLYFTDREQWRLWLTENADRRNHVWLIYFKKRTGKPTIPYDDAVEEALCFGWIDGLVRRLDDERYMQRYTPRKPRSMWSDSNKARVEKMLRLGRMTPAGLAVVAAARDDGTWDLVDETRLLTDPPEALLAALAENPVAQDFFLSLAPSQRKQYTWWIVSAKKEETRARRISRVVAWCAQRKKPGMM
jgi:uncharacterized protein YdeI (YjbR/CyaY-like superfamily)